MRLKGCQEAQLAVLQRLVESKPSKGMQWLVKGAIFRSAQRLWAGAWLLKHFDMVRYASANGTLQWFGDEGLKTGDVAEVVKVGVGFGQFDISFRGKLNRFLEKF